jgi:hypothetical protein
MKMFQWGYQILSDQENVPLNCRNCNQRLFPIYEESPTVKGVWTCFNTKCVMVRMLIDKDNCVMSKHLKVKDGKNSSKVRD